MSAIKSENLFDGPQRQQRKRNKAQNNVQLNPAISPPYLQKWPEIKKQHQKMILEETKDVFQEKVADLWILNKRRKITTNHSDRSVEKCEEILRTIISKQEKYTGKDVEKLLSSLDDPGKMKSMKELKEFVLIGTRDLSRCQEKNIDLSLVICCRSADGWMCQNLLCQSLLRNIPVCSVNGLSDVLSLRLGVNQVRAIGFKKVENNPFDDLVEFIIDKIPNISCSWTKLWGQEGTYGKRLKLCSSQKEVDPKNKDKDTAMCATVCTSNKKDDTAVFSDGSEKQDIEVQNIKHSEADELSGNNIGYLEMNIMWKEKKNVCVKKDKKASQLLDV